MGGREEGREGKTQKETSTWGQARLGLKPWRVEGAAASAAPSPQPPLLITALPPPTWGRKLWIFPNKEGKHLLWSQGSYIKAGGELREPAANTSASRDRFSRGCGAFNSPCVFECKSHDTLFEGPREKEC